MDPRVRAAERQHAGVFRVAEARACGHTWDEIRHLVVAGTWIRVRHGILADAQTAARICAAPDGPYHLAVAAEICARSIRLVASHHTAARLLGLEFVGDVRDTVLLSTDVEGRARKAASAHIRHVALPSNRVIICDGLPCTSAARTVVDLARELPFRDAVVLADSALRKRLTSRKELETVLLECRSWQGIREASRVVAFSDGRAEAVSESVARVVFAELGLPAPEPQVIIEDRAGVIGRVDFLFKEQRTIAEIDGKVKYRDDPDARFKEKKREELLEGVGFEVVRLTWEEIMYKPEVVLRKIQRAFARAATLAA